MRVKTATTIILVILSIIWVLLTINTPFPSPEAARVGPIWQMQSEQLFSLGILGTATTVLSLVLIRQLDSKIEALESRFKERTAEQKL